MLTKFHINTSYFISQWGGEYSWQYCERNPLPPCHGCTFHSWAFSSPERRTQWPSGFYSSPTPRMHSDHIPIKSFCQPLWAASPESPTLSRSVANPRHCLDEIVVSHSAQTEMLPVFIAGAVPMVVIVFGFLWRRVVIRTSIGKRWTAPVNISRFVYDLRHSNIQKSQIQSGLHYRKHGKWTVTCINNNEPRQSERKHGTKTKVIIIINNDRRWDTPASDTSSCKELIGRHRQPGWLEQVETRTKRARHTLK